MSDPVLLTLAELAAALGCSPKQIYSWTRNRTANAIPRLTVGRGYRFILADVLDWLRAHRDNRLLAPPLRGRPPLPGPGLRVLPPRRRRAPKRPLEGRGARNPGGARVPANGPAAVAAPLPSNEANATGGGHEA